MAWTLKDPAGNAGDISHVSKHVRAIAEEIRTDSLNHIKDITGGRLEVSRDNG